MAMFSVATPSHIATTTRVSTLLSASRRSKTLSLWPNIRPRSTLASGFTMRSTTLNVTTMRSGALIGHAPRRENRSEERRVGKEGRDRREQWRDKNKTKRRKKRDDSKGHHS